MIFPTRRPAARWPLWLFAALLLLGALLLWLLWPQLLLQSADWQRQLNRETTRLLLQVAGHSERAGAMLIGFSLLYGVVHAAGPGHGKVVIATFLATHPTRLKTSLWLTLLSSLLQGAVAIVLVTVCLHLLALSSRQLHLSSYWLEKGSYLLVMLLGGVMIWRALRQIRQRLRPPRIQALYPPASGGACAQPAAGRCGCGHQHLPDPQQLAQAVTGRMRLAVVLSMGLRPCSGAIMMLLFAKVIGVYAWGVVAALVMAAGTALTVSLMALLVQLSRRLAVRLSRGRGGAQGLGAATLLLAGGVLLLVAGGVLWQAAQPIASGGLRAL